MFASVHQALDPIRDRIKDHLEQQGYRPRTFTVPNFRAFLGEIPGATKLILREPEILVFAVVQWAVIWLGYLAWMRGLALIPDEAWTYGPRTYGHARTLAAPHLLLIGWLFLIVGVASYPIGLCNAAMMAAGYLRRSGEKVTLSKCLGIAQQHLTTIWKFTAIDSWAAFFTPSPVNVTRFTPHREKVRATKLLRHAWLISTMGVVPALMNGRNLVEAGRDSLLLLTVEPLRVIGLRLGYNAVCRIVGVTAYLASLVAYSIAGGLDAVLLHAGNVYFLLVPPLFVSIVVVSVLVRPLFLLSVATLYTDHIDVKAEIEDDLAEWEDEAKEWRPLWFLLALLALMVTAYFADQFGFLAWARHMADTGAWSTCDATHSAARAEPGSGRSARSAAPSLLTFFRPDYQGRAAACL